MDRKGPRGTKPKNMPLPGNLITLGNKSGRGDAQSDKTSSHGSSFAPSKTSGGSGDRVRDGGTGTSGMLGKKPKAGFGGGPGVVRPGVSKPTSVDMVNLLSEEWETGATEVDPNDLIPFIEAGEEYGDSTEMYLCGAVKSLRSQRTKPDNLLCFSLMYLVKVKPHLFSRSKMVVEAFCSLLKRDHSMTYKSKGNAAVSVLAANILLAAFQEEKSWPQIFVRVYMEDSLGERVWVDHEDCKGFVDNIATAFRTKLPPKSLLYPDLGMGSRQDCPSPPVSGGSGGADSGDGDSELSLECKESLDVSVTNRYAESMQDIEEMVMEAVQHQLGVRHQSPDAVARNFIRFLSSVCGILEVRRHVAPRLEMWLQSPKLQRPATELLMSLCLNCNTHSQLDVECISHIIRIRLKHKPLINQYMSCLKELLAAHADNIPSVMKHTLYNELSQARNPSNMSILSVIFQFAPEHAAIILAEEFQELLCNREDFLRALRALLREIVRALRHDMQFQKFCQGLMKDRKDPSFRESFEFKERMFHSITDLIVLTVFVAISPQVRESAAQMYRGEHRDPESVRRYQEMVASIQRDAIHWLYRVVPKCYNPSKEEFNRSLHKILMFEQAEVYFIKDNWPTENDRPLYFRLTSEIPVKQETVTRMLMIAVMKDQWMKSQDLLESVDKLIKRATALHNDDMEVLHLDDIKIVELIFNLCPYIPPENSPLPQGYRPPKTAIANLYWKSWIMLLLITAHNPSVFGLLAWESYPTLRTLMEMCITNSFVFPPPTLASGEKGEEMTTQEIHLFAIERQHILDFESHLAQKTITEQNSLLLSQLITMDPTGPARKPPVIVLEQLKSLNTSHKIGHLLCRSRSPDFLVDIIQRQGASQSMPWLAELVQSSEGAFSVLPVQCLCEFLLSEAGTGSGGGEGATRHHQLLQHLRSLLRAPRQEDGVSVEILEYFLRRLSSQQALARTQAVRGLQLVVAPINDPMEIDGDSHTPHAWLLQHLPNLPGFDLVQGVASQALRAACQIETDPHAVSAYIRFLAVHTRDDPLQDQAELVQDMAQLIVERCTMISAILPMPDRPNQPFANAHSTLKALLIIFINYMRGVRLPPRESFTWSESQDQVRVQWASGEQAVMHILVVHAMVILLTHGPDNSPDLFHELLTTWFPEQEEMPQAFLVDTSEEALLLPDWLKLKMIRSTVPQLVDAALKDLEPSQLVLFIQSFGIPVASMTKLLCALDVAVKTNDEAVAAAVLDKSHKTYMAQLVEVQHQRGAKGGHAFAATLGERDDMDVVGERPPHILPLVTPLKVQDTMRVLQRHFSREISRQDPEGPYINEFLSSLNAIMHSPQHAPTFVAGLHDHYVHSASLFRLLKSLDNKKGCENLYGRTCQLVAIILRMAPNRKSPLTHVLQAFNIEEIQCQEVKKIEPEVEVDVSSTQAVLVHLANTKPNQLEKEICHVVGCAMKGGKMAPAVGALSQLLLSSISVKHDQEAAAGTSPPTALLLDWLQVLDPELEKGSDQLQQILLFKKRGIERKEGGYSQAYLLAAFTHQARWDTLEHCVRALLRVHCPTLDSAAVLGFVWAVLHVPKLWQGRERRTPRHAPRETLLNFSVSEVVHISQYMIAECQAALEAGRGTVTLETHLPLLLHSLDDSPVSIQALAEHLAKISHESGSMGQAAGHLLYHLYLRMPRIISYLTPGTINRVVSAGACGGTAQESGADVALHTLLTMLAAPEPDRNFRRRMCDLESAVRKQAASHPLIVLRHLPLLAASLKGTNHLQLTALRARNYLELFSMILGVLELLQPLLFAPQHHKALTPTLDSFMALFKAHPRTHELGHLLVRFSHLLMEWVGCQGGPAGTYLCSHSNLLATLQMHHPDIAAVRSLAAIAAARGMDQPKESASNQQFGSDPSLPVGGSHGPLPPPWIMAQVGELQARLEASGLPEDQLDILRKVIDLPDRWVNAALPSFTHTFCEGIVSEHREVRCLCWELVSRLLHQRPALGGRVGQAVFSALRSEDSAVVETALEHLPEVILLLHNQAADLLTAAFVSTLTASSNATGSLSEALTLLHLHTGA
ncbi:Integrator complex subunit 1-like [Homarus americanus]|uniref:Integrator complex subunit 1-like n=1 Tax=Homarus americanus TaxID=6706 RepID=A0A8J5JZP3_HOMAM|nr:Integrator complex subunit 1-like [Homarus americanus]